MISRKNITYESSLRFNKKYDFAIGGDKGIYTGQFNNQNPP